MGVPVTFFVSVPLVRRLHSMDVGKQGLQGHHAAEAREFCIDDLLVRIHLIIVMMRWTGLAPREFEFPFPTGVEGGVTAGG